MLELVRIGDASAPIGAGGDEVKVIDCVETPQPSHHEITPLRCETGSGRDIKEDDVCAPVTQPQRRATCVHLCCYPRLTTADAVIDALPLLETATINVASKKTLMLVGDYVQDYEVMVPFQALLTARHAVDAV